MCVCYGCVFFYFFEDVDDFVWLGSVEEILIMMLFEEFEVGELMGVVMYVFLLKLML